MILASDVINAEAWGRLNGHQKIYMCESAGVRVVVGPWERIPPPDRGEIRAAAGRLVGFASQLGGLIQ